VVRRVFLVLLNAFVKKLDTFGCRFGDLDTVLGCYQVLLSLRIPLQKFARGVSLMVGILHAIKKAGPYTAVFQDTGKWLCALATGLVLAAGTILASDVRADEFAALDREINAIKSDVASLSQTLFELEESVLHPADTQVAVFLTLKDKDGLALDSVELYLDGSPVSSHLYTDRERESLRKGGIQRLYMGNIPHGSHQLKAVLTARSANERFIRREVRHEFRKRPGESRIQMTLDAAAPDYEPVVSFQEWK
jgi:hypothetical protein